MSLLSNMTPEMLNELLNGPALAPPNGATPNFTNPHNFRAVNLAVQILFLVLSTLAVAVRVYTRIRINRKVELEDYLCFLAWGLFIGIYVTAFTADPLGSRHQWDLQLKNMEKVLYQLHIGQTLYGCVIMALKASILLQYIRIFSAAFRGVFFWTCHALIWINFVFYGACFFIEIFSCKPISKAWNPLLSGTCIDIYTVNIVASAINAASDFTIFLLPQSLIWSLHMSLGKKIGVSILLASALLACISATIRLYYSVALSRSPDILWWASTMSMYVFPELGIGIIVSCLPAVAKFCRSVGYPEAFSRLGTTLSSFFGRASIRNTSRRSQDVVEGTTIPREKPGSNSFYNLIELPEIAKPLRKETSKSTSNRNPDSLRLYSPHDGTQT